MKSKRLVMFAVVAVALVTVILPPSKPVVAVMRVEETSVEKKVAIVPDGERSSVEETTPIGLTVKKNCPVEDWIEKRLAVWFVRPWIWSVEEGLSVARPRKPVWFETARILLEVAIWKMVLEELIVEVASESCPIEFTPRSWVPVEEAIVKRLAVWVDVPWTRSVVEAAAVPCR